MSSDFDPYREWLGIKSEQRPPDHYELLGLNLFEERTEIIDQASIDRVELLQDIATGSDDVELSQRILNEVSAARLCLLDRNQRERYNLQLRKKQLGMDSIEVKMARLQNRHAGTAESATDKKQTVPQRTKTRAASSSVQPQVHRRGKKKKFDASRAIVVTVLVVMFLVLLVTLLVAAVLTG